MATRNGKVSRKAGLVLALVMALCSLFSAVGYAQEGVVIIHPSIGNVKLGETYTVEGAYALRAASCDFSAIPGKDTHRLATVTLWYQNLSDSNVQLDKVSTLKLSYRERFNFDLMFQTYAHVTDQSVRPASYEADPLVEILSVWTTEVPKAVAEGTDELLLEMVMDGDRLTFVLR
ncbi:hypothetical protein FACS1894196_4850 [Clostridia bacterium]|nr:hypothetical protein FACS1894196_4850 [Clostridia bacterium]